MALLPLSLLLSTLTLTTPPAGESSPPAPRGRESEPFALTLSGGVSLGAYEGGLSWALVRYLREIEKDAQVDLSERHPQLVTVTGASAGSINALLVALAWCTEESYQGSIDHNDFRSTWAGVGLDELLPSSHGGPFSSFEPRYDSTDGLFTRRAFESVIASFRARLDWRRSRHEKEKPYFRYPCEVPLGITVTRAVPETVEEAGLRIPRQRFSILWKLETDSNGRAHIRNQFLPGDGSSDALVYLTESPVYATASPPRSSTRRRSSSAFQVELRKPSSVEAEAVIKAIEASSAFPFAFGPVRLSYCAPSCSNGAPPSSSMLSDPYCQAIADGLQQAAPEGARVPPLQVCRQEFFDGGVFDNTPVGTALRQAEQFLTKHPVSAPNPLRPLTYLFVDPDFRRLPASPSGVKGKEVPDLLNQLEFISSAIGTARSFELHNAIQNKGWNQTLRSHARGTAAWLFQLAQFVGSPSHLAAPTGEARGAYGRRLAGCLKESPVGPSLNACLRALDQTRGEDTEPVLFSTLVDIARRTHAGLVDSGATCDRDTPLLEGEARTVARRLELAALAQGFLAEELNRSDYGRATSRELDELRQSLLAVTSTLRRVLDCAGDLGRTQGSRSTGKPLSVLSLEESLPTLEKEAEALTHLTRDRSMIVSSRFSPLASSQLRNFGAFLDEPLRMTDYYIGIYEAAHQLAENFCAEQDPYNTVVWEEGRRLQGTLDLKEESLQHCIGEKLEFITGKLDVARSGPASHVFETLAKLELRAALGDEGQQRVLASPQWKWLSTFPPFPKHRVLLDDTITVSQVLRVLTSKETFCQDPFSRGRCFEDLDLEELSQGLAREGYAPRSESMRLFLADPMRWKLELAMRSMSRISAIHGEAHPNSEFVPALNAGRLLMTRQAGLREALRINASSVPLGQTPLGTSVVTPWLFTLVPYRASIDVAHRGLMLSWFEPVVRPTDRLTGRLGLNPLELRWKDSVLPYVSSSVTPSMAYAVSSLASVGAGPTVEARWREQGREQWALGGEVYADFAQERIRLGLGFRDTPGTPWAGLVYLSFADLNGMLFWMTR
ncbi:patatin-like phospholipase family protein [Pyxidicoccus fallax]|uniref:Patatin-like phospholipase family protein n=1 Tax=Pyxidicoccus fallax TaxID=394095 RepID=A0A848LQT5_9BACT|nr:patatin-like phospholipase family protein [Pyxidicoccus fallax]NMO19913.1 patatin-like phospholipase family protein [Pyxidicoccus fallax]NPC82006.1 patatin-like phospholipase family protein [Pyxidicoccus fallax]